MCVSKQMGLVPKVQTACRRMQFPATSESMVDLRHQNRLRDVLALTDGCCLNACVNSDDTFRHAFSSTNQKGSSYQD